MKCLVKEQTRVADKKRGEKFVFVGQSIYDVNVSPRTVDDVQAATLQLDGITVNIFNVSSLRVKSRYIEFHGYVAKYDPFIGKKTAYPIRLRCYPKC